MFFQAVIATEMHGVMWQNTSVGYVELHCTVQWTWPVYTVHQTLPLLHVESKSGSPDYVCPKSGDYTCSKGGFATFCQDWSCNPNFSLMRLPSVCLILHDTTACDKLFFCICKHKLSDQILEAVATGTKSFHEESVCTQGKQSNTGDKATQTRMLVSFRQKKFCIAKQHKATFQSVELYRLLGVVWQ